MNKQIKQLVEQATTIHEYGWGASYAEFDQEKFAQLIVLECIAQCEKNAEHEWLGSGSKLSAFNIKQHFGVGL